MTGLASMPEDGKEVIARHLAKLNGIVPGFPDNERKFQNAVEALAEFVSTQPTPHSALGVWNKPDCTHAEAESGKRSHCERCGADKVVESPAVWLIRKLRHHCTWWPSMREIRVIYCEYFKPLDGVEPNLHNEIGGRRRRSESED